MGLLVHQKKRVDILQVVCNMLQIMAMNLRKESLSTTSNNKASNIYTQDEVKEDEIVH
jgi:hypothetical protein